MLCQLLELVAEKVKAVVTFVAVAVKNSQKFMTWWVSKSAEAKLSKYAHLLIL